MENRKSLITSSNKKNIPFFLAACLLMIVSAVQAAKLKECVKNGDFSVWTSALPEQWSAGEGVKVEKYPEGAQASSNAVKLTGSGRIVSLSANHFSQRKVFRNGRKYKFSAKVKNVSGSGFLEIGIAYVRKKRIRPVFDWKTIEFELTGHNRWRELTFGASKGSTWLISKVSVKETGMAVQSERPQPKKIRKEAVKTAVKEKKKVDISGCVYYDSNNNKKCDVNEKGIPGVLISDGKNIQKTDSNGKYIFKTISTGINDCVFIIIPNGWLATSSFFFNANQNMSNANFGLRKDPAGKQHYFSFVHGADIQYNVTHYLAKWQLQYKRLQGIAKKGNAAFIIATGDLTPFGKIRNLQAIKTETEKYKIPLKPVFGGHDGLVVKPKPGIKNYVKIFGPAYYSWNYAGVHFIALISEPYFASPSFFKQQWTWVKKDLAQISATVPVIITTHDINPQAHELKKIESSHNLIALLCGHRHINHHYKAGKTAIFFSGPWRDYDWGANTNRVRIISWQGGKLKSRTSVLWNNADVKLSGAKVVRHKIKLNWPNFSGQSGARASAANITLPLELAWVINTGSYQPFFGSPVIVNGKIYYGVTDGQADFKNSGVICLNAKTGQQIWKTSIPGDFYSTVLLSDKYVFAMNAVGSCFALDANTGKIYWRTDPSPCKNYLKQYSYRLALAPLSFYNGTLFAVYNSGIMAISADTGKLLWQNNSFVARNYPIAGVAAGKQNIYGETQHELFALNQKDGSLRWCKKRKDLVHNIKRERAIATPAYVDNAVYFSARKTLRKLDRNGKEIWSTETNGMGLNYLSSPAIHNNKTVFAYDRFITCMDATSGQILWKFTCRTPKQAGYGAYQTIMNGASPVIADGKVFCGSDDGYLYILDLETGKKLQEIQIGSPIKASVAISNNFICISDFNGKIYAFSH